MLKAVKVSVRKMTSHLQLINGYLEVHDYAEALVKTTEGIKELPALPTSLTGLSNIRMTVPNDDWDQGEASIRCQPLHNEEAAAGLGQGRVGLKRGLEQTKIGE